MAPDTDVLVLGAGPAGSSLAARLADAGFAVVLADKKEFPRDKPCGEFLSPECRPYLDALGVAATLSARGAHDVVGMRLHGYGERAVGHFRVVGDRPASAGVGLAIRRREFDHVLLDAARARGVAWLPRHTFAALRRDGNGRIVGADLFAPDGSPRAVAARWVVGADGVHSAVARDLGVQRREAWLDQFALVAHFAGVTPQATAEVHLLPGGFFAATTVDAGVFSLNLVVPRARLRDRTARADGWDGFVASHFADAPALAERLRGSTRLQPWRGIGPFAHRTTAQVRPGAALVGDAAGYVDPLTGEGVYFALFGGRSLAEALAAALHSPARERAALDGYLRARRRELAPRLRASRLLQRALRHPALVRTVLRRADRWRWLADFLVTLSGDTIHPRELLRPSFWRAFGAAAS